MASKSTTLTVKILTDASQASKGTKQAASTYQKFESGIDRMVPAAAAVTAALALAGKGAVDAASRTEQAMGALDAVFGKNASTVKKWSQEAATAVGLSAAEYGELASVAGAQLKNLGLSQQDALAGTKDMISLGADLAATFGGTTTDAVNALSAALRGEADPAERYGLSLSQTAINAKLAEKGMSGLTGTALQQAKAQTILEMATAQSGEAVGQFAREQNTVAGQQQRANAQFQNAVSTLGTSLLPIVTAVTKQLGTMAKWVGENSTLVMSLAAVIGTLAAGILAASAAMKAWTIITTAWSAITKGAAAVQVAFNAVMAANPIGIIITAVLALVAALVWFFTKTELGKKIWAAFTSFLADSWKNIVSFFQTTFAAIGQWWSDVWAGIKAVAKAVADWFVAAWQFVSAVFRAYINVYVVIFKVVFNAIRAVVQAVVSWFQSAWQNAVNGVRGIINALRAAFAQVFNGVRSIVSSVASFFRSAWQNAINAVSNVVRGIQSVFTNVFNAILRPINAVKDAVAGVVNWVKDLIGWIGRIKIPNLSALNPFKATAQTVAVQAAPAGPGVGARLAGYQVSPAPRVGAAALSASAGAGGGITIVIQGGLDSKDAIARRVEQIVGGRVRRTRGVVNGLRVPS